MCTWSWVRWLRYLPIIRRCVLPGTCWACRLTPACCRNRSSSGDEIVKLLEGTGSRLDARRPVAPGCPFHPPQLEQPVKVEDPWPSRTQLPAGKSRQADEDLLDLFLRQPRGTGQLAANHGRGH